MGRIVTDVGLEKPEGKRELKKHAATIHCSNSLSLLQRKVSNALLYHAYKEMMTKEEHDDPDVEWDRAPKQALRLEKLR